MNVIFLTLVRISSIEDRGIYHDLMRKFRKEGHHVYIVTPCERRLGLQTHLMEEAGVHILNVKTLNIQKTNIIEKGIGTLLLGLQYKLAIKKNLKGVSFDLITYSTPPVTLTNVVKYLKKHNPKAISYLQLKDIFPQNAVDIGLFGKRSFFYWYFHRKEKGLYGISNYIGCMSPANVDYFRKNNLEIVADRVEVAPNSIELKENLNDDSTHTLQENQNEKRQAIREKYDIPTDKTIFIYGGNLGKPQGVSFLIQCLEAIKYRKDCFFVIIGSGTDFPKLKVWCDNLINNNYNSISTSFKCYSKQTKLSVSVLYNLPKAEYDELIKSCDVGLIFLDHRFTIPCYPSKLLSYLENRMPVLCATDPNTDMGRIAEENGYGYWCESNSIEAFTSILDKMIQSDRKAMGERGYQFLKENYLVENTYSAIMKHFE